MKNQDSFTSITTVGALKKSGYSYTSVKDELRRNLIEKIANGETGESIFPGIYGYEGTVVKQIMNAILSKHNFILLGLRGQGKTKLIRLLVNLLDEVVPAIEGSLLNEHPLAPLSPKYLKPGGLPDNTPIRWIPRAERFNEKLATPDVSIADLLGDIDPIKAAREKLDISNEEIIHWGIIPRSNRGIFAVNELPDLQPRIQVGLFNILEEQDIQIRGFPLRIPLDILLVFSANPEDYTNRGRIITPLKDRIESQIITHYPRERTIAKEITRKEVDTEVLAGVRYSELVLDIIEEITVQARESELSDSMSGVSQRLSIAALENIAASALRRHLLTEGKEGKSGKKSKNTATIRMIDLYAAVSAITGKVELVEERSTEEIEQIAGVLINQAITKVVSEHLPPLFAKTDTRPSRSKHSKHLNHKISESEEYENNHSLTEYDIIMNYFKDGNTAALFENMNEDEYRNTLGAIPGIAKLINKHFLPSIKKILPEEVKDMGDEDSFHPFYAEIILEYLHGQSGISRKVAGGTVTFVDIYSSMFRGM